MSNEVKNTVAFVTGALVGAAAAWYFTKDKYAKLAQEEIDDVKATFARHFGEKHEEPVSEEIDIPEKKVESRFAAVSSLGVFGESKIDTTDYSSITGGLGYSGEVIDEPEKVDKPYVITQNDYGEFGDYMEMSLTYYADGIVADDDDEIIEDVEAVLGTDFQNEFEDDVVLIRNDARKCDYEVVRDDRTYHEVTGR